MSQQPEQIDPTAVSDDPLAALVRDVAEGWAMPPVRLDQPTWRDRVTARHPSRAFDGAAWLRRLGRSVALAAVAVVIVALVGVALTTRPVVPPAGPLPTAAVNGSATPEPSASRYPAGTFKVTGKRPSVTRSLVQLEEGQYAVLDLEHNALRGAIGSPGPPGWDTLVRTLDDGSIYCVCVVYSVLQALQPTHAVISFERYTADGELISRTQIAHFDGAPDPRDGNGVPEEPDHVRVHVSVSADAKIAYLGWSERHHPVWKSGVLVVDVAQGKVLGSLDLPDTTDGDGDTRRMTDAPRLAGTTADGLIVSRPYYTWSPPASAQPNIRPSVEAFDVAVSGGLPVSAEPIPAADGCGYGVEAAGGLDNGLWIACLSDTSQIVVRRVGMDGLVIGETTASTYAEIDGSTIAISPDRSKLYVWDPVRHRLTRVDVATGDSDYVESPAARLSSDDLLTALGRWLVPSAAAKMLLSAGVALSADGTHLYALGATGVGAVQAGSTGVYAFTVGAAMSVTNWPPTADFVSVAISSDGRYVYAAGMGGVDASGATAPQQASVTVYDASSGDVDSFAQGLPTQLLTFPEQIIR